MLLYFFQGGTGFFYYVYLWRPLLWIFFKGWFHILLQQISFLDLFFTVFLIFLLNSNICSVLLLLFIFLFRCLVIILHDLLLVIFLGAFRKRVANAIYIVIFGGVIYHLAIAIVYLNFYRHIVILDIIRLSIYALLGSEVAVLLNLNGPLV
jgi:hypothetical protein